MKRFLVFFLVFVALIEWGAVFLAPLAPRQPDRQWPEVDPKDHVARARQREVDAKDIGAGENQLLEHARMVGGRTERRDDLGTSPSVLPAACRN